MKKLYTILTAIILTATLWAQSPETISYQAVIRNSSDALVTNTQIGMEINIRQGTPTGTVVYSETQTPATNANGLVSIEIGGGEGFSTIDWSAGPYYIETKTAVTPPLTSYTIMGTSQLLSVPYALHAKTAESVISVKNSHFIGELYGGGVVYWVDNTGEHGFITSMIDLSQTQDWSNRQTNLIGPNAQSDWNGRGNTASIIAQYGHTSSAAKLCEDYTNADYGTGIYSDWYLPSRCELYDLWKNIYPVQKILEKDGNDSTIPLAKSSYWSSSERDSYQAYQVSLASGEMTYRSKWGTAFVRAIRAF